MIKSNGVRKGMKKFSMRRTGFRLGRRSLTSSSSRTINLKIEHYDFLAVPTLGGDSLFYSTGFDYVTFASILANNNMFISQIANYSRYKINGCSVDLGRSCDSDAFAKAFPGGNVSALGPGYLVPYPTLTGSSAGAAPATADNNFVYRPFISTHQSKFWKYGKEYTTTGVGVGTWNAVGVVASQTGQISVNMPGISTNAGAPSLVHSSIRVVLYVQLGQQYR